MMMLMFVMLAAAVTTGAIVALLITTSRRRHRQRLGRTRREGDYAKRRSTWSAYVGLNTSRRARRITDQREPRD